MKKRKIITFCFFLHLKPLWLNTIIGSKVHFTSSFSPLRLAFPRALSPVNALFVVLVALFFRFFENPLFRKTGDLSMERVCIRRNIKWNFRFFKVMSWLKKKKRENKKYWKQKGEVCSIELFLAPCQIRFVISLHKKVAIKKILPLRWWLISDKTLLRPVSSIQNVSLFRAREERRGTQTFLSASRRLARSLVSLLLCVSPPAHSLASRRSPHA